MSIMWSVYATPGGQHATGKNPFGRDCLGFVWATSGPEAVSKFAEREGLDPAGMEY